MGKKHLILIMLMSFIGGMVGSLILNTLQPTDSFAKQQPKAISVNKINFFDETGKLRGEISGYSHGLSFAATESDEETENKIGFNLDSSDGEFEISKSHLTAHDGNSSTSVSLLQYIAQHQH